MEKLGAQGLRRSSRVPKELPIRLIGSDAQGKDFVEQTKTVLLSRHGAGIVSTHKLVVEQEMIFVHLKGNKEAEVRVVGQIGSEDGFYTYGVAFVDPGLDFWGVEFPCSKQDETSECGMALQCNSCGRREFITAGGLESDIYAIHDGLIRDCSQCRNLTFWQQAPEGVAKVPRTPEAGEATSIEPASELASPAVPVPAPERLKNRREHPRVRVNYTACVRNAAYEERMVQCENVSRGGLCFKSTQRFFENTRIEIAAPYYPGSLCLFVPAKIVFVQELPEEGMFRCGVQYLQLTKDPRA